MEYHVIGKASRTHLNGGRPELVKLVELALWKCRIDISVVDCLRTITEQRQNIINGVSWTMNSFHLPDKSGRAGAVDLYPWVDGKTSHSPYHYKLIARAMFAAAIELGIQIRWGGLWSEEHLDLMHWQLADHIPLVPLQEAA